MAVLFNAVLQFVFRYIDIEDLGLNINGKQLTNLRFADDTVLIAENSSEHFFV